MPAASASELTAPERPVLHLDGPRLVRSFETLVRQSERDGGVERYIAGLRFKASLFQEMLAPDRLAVLEEETFLGLCAFMAPVRRRIGSWLREAGMDRMRDLLAALLEDAEDTTGADRRLAAFCEGFPTGRGYRWVRDLAAEVLHYALPEQYPLMTRWVWDRGANTGVLREIWHGENVDQMTIDVADDHATFLMLREELSQFLSANGVFRDMLFYVDLLCAQIYADYIVEQGGAFLRAEFASEHDPMQYTRRMLGLDGVDPRSGRTRTKAPDGADVIVFGRSSAPH